MYEKRVFLRFYEELNDFLKDKYKKTCFSYTIKGQNSVKDLVESVGVPHTEIDLILVNQKSVDFSYKVRDNDYISVFPVFEKLDITSVTKLRPGPLRKTQFVVDVNLGKLANYLRILGFDTKYRNNFEDEEIINISLAEKRIILTRDIGILKNSRVTHAYWIRETSPKKQLVEVCNYFNLHSLINPFTRCPQCNHKLFFVNKEAIVNEIPRATYNYFKEFKKCSNCGKIYWKGSHWKWIQSFINSINSYTYKSYQEEEKSDSS